MALRLFSRKKNSLKSGWRSVVRDGNALLMAHVVAGEGMPKVLAVEEFPVGEHGLPAEVLAHLQGAQGVTLLEPASYQLLQMEAPKVPREEWKQALLWSLTGMLDFPAEQATFDVLEVPVEAYAPGRPATVLVAVARNEVVGGVMERFPEADLAAIDVPELALRNVSARLEPANRGQACLSFDGAGGLLVVTFNGELYASRRIEISLGQLGQADMERKQQLFERIGLELQRSLDAFDRQYSFISLSRLLIAPRPELGGLLDYLATTLYAPVELLDLGQALDLSACPLLQQPQQQSRFLLAIGAAMRDMPGGRG